MTKAYKHLFAGFLLAMLDINLGSFDILPDVVGYLLVFSGLGALHAETEIESFGVARIFSGVMAIIAVLELFTGTFRVAQMSSYIAYAVMVLGTLSQLLLVVWIYQGMTMQMAVEDNIPLSQRFADENKRYAAIQGLSLIVTAFSLNMPRDSNGGAYLLVLLLVIGIIMHIRLLMNLSYAGKHFETGEAPE